MPKASSRPSLPTSSSDFALPPSSNVTSTSTLPSEDANPLFLRFRRPSTLAAPKATYLTETRLHSPLVASFTHRRRGSMITEESDGDRMWTDSSPSGSSENPTPPLALMDNGDDMERNTKGTASTRPLTPPRKSSFNSIDTQEQSSRNKRRLSFPLKPPRIINLLAESRPEENEVKSEAAFQRLVTSCSELPMQPRTPRNTSDRGRYPEEAVEEENQREDTPSDDGDCDDAIFAFLPPSSEPINIGKPLTPANSVNGDDPTMWISESPGAGSVAMDVDTWSGSPSITCVPTQWRYTPPPTTSAVRSNKRKFDDRYDPYPIASKRRAVSPSISYLRETHPSLVSPILNARTVSGTPRLPMSVPISIPGSAVSSAASSPTITGSYPISGITLSRPASITSSPILRAQMGLASPILRPIPRRREEREVEGAGEAVGGLTLG